MPDFFETELHEGTTRVVESFTPPSAEAVRRHSERRSRRRRGVAVALVLVLGGATVGVAGPGFGHSTAPAGPARTVTASPSVPPNPSGTASPAAADGVFGLSLKSPAHFAAATPNEVELLIVNPGRTLPVIVQFDAPGSKSQYWVEPCDSGVGGGCSKASYNANPLKVHTSIFPPAAGTVDFDLALPPGKSTYNAWVDPPDGVTSFNIRVLDGTKVLAQITSSPIRETAADAFPKLTKVTQDSTTLTRGGTAVGFTTKVEDVTGTSYVNLFSFMSFSCKAGSTVVSVPQDAYTLEWNAGGGHWLNVGTAKELGQFGYDLSAGQSTSSQFRLSVSNALPADVTSCEVTQVVSASDTSTPPYYDQSAPNAQTVVAFTVG